jgi:hypothetical protein
VSLPFAVTTRTGIASLSLVLALGAAPRHASAVEPGAPAPAARLDVIASSDCTSRSDLIARVRARSPRIRFADDDVTFDIRAEFTATPAGSVAGSVALASTGTKPSVRRVLGRSCGDAADAVALIIAVTLDPSAAVREQSAAKSEARAVAPPVPAGPVAAASHETAKSDSLGQHMPGASAAPAARSRISVAVQVAAQALLGPAPKIMPGIALYATIGIERSALWSPAVLLGVSHAWRTGIDEQGGTAAFTLNAASADACPVRLRWGPVDARPCASVLMGLLGASGSQTRNRATESGRPFWVVGGAAVATVELSDLVEVTARVAVGRNLVRDSFVFTPVVFHQVPALTAAASLGIGLRFR